MDVLRFVGMWHGRDLLAFDNHLSGIVPSSLASKFGATAFNLNCLSNYTTQPWCPLPFLQLQALTDLYAATNGSGWTNNANWLTRDPCLDAWFGVTCNSAKTAVMYVWCQNQHQCMCRFTAQTFAQCSTLISTIAKYIRSF